MVNTRRPSYEEMVRVAELMEYLKHLGNNIKKNNIQLKDNKIKMNRPELDNKIKKNRAELDKKKIENGEN